MKDRAITEGWSEYEEARKEADLYSAFIEVCVAYADPHGCKCGCVTAADVASARREYNRFMDEHWGPMRHWEGRFISYEEEHGAPLDPDLAFALKLGPLTF